MSCAFPLRAQQPSLIGGVNDKVLSEVVFKVFYISEIIQFER